MTALKSPFFSLLLLAAVMALQGPASPVAAVGQSRAANAGDRDRDLINAIDVHLHTIPDQELLPEVKEVISVIARHGLVLATGHSTAEEGLLLVREGHRQGVQHMVVTHAMSRVPRMTIAEMQAAAREGAFIELVYVHTLTIPELKRTANFTMPEAAEAIRQVGVASMILSTDMGQVGIPLPIDGLAQFAAGLRAQGFTNGDLDRMMKENPARLLGLPAPAR